MGEEPPEDEGAEGDIGDVPDEQTTCLSDDIDDTGLDPEFLNAGLEEIEADYPPGHRQPPQPQHPACNDVEIIWVDDTFEEDEYDEMAVTD